MIKFPKINATPLMTFLANAWLTLTRTLQSSVEHMRVTNTEATALVDGELLYLVAGDRQALRTTAASSAAAEFVAVSCEPTAASGRGVSRTQGLAWVLFEPALTIVAGQPAYTAITPGRASNLPVAAGWYKRIGTIEDMSTYAAQGGCYVNLNHCCTPSERQA